MQLSGKTSREKDIKMQDCIPTERQTTGKQKPEDIQKVERKYKDTDNTQAETSIDRYAEDIQTEDRSKTDNRQADKLRYRPTKIYKQKTAIDLLHDDKRQSFTRNTYN